jgi:SAM-dependent methyltransferase
MKDSNKTGPGECEGAVRAGQSIESCPSCASNSYTVFGPRTAGSTGEVDGCTFTEPEYEVRRCSICSLCYKSDTLSDEELNEYYHRVDFRKWEVNGFFPTEAATINVVKGLPRGSRVLDFGCSTGRLLSGLVNDYACFGIEVNRKAAEIAAQKGISIVSPGLEAQILASGLDAVILVDVLEHLRRPVETLAWLSGHFRGDGAMVIVSGDSDSWACQEDASNFWYFRNPEHLSMMNRRWAEWMGDNLGLELIEWQTMSHYKTGLVERLRQHTQHVAYRQFHEDRRILPVGILSRIPIIGKASRWTFPPSITCTADHAVAVLRRRPGG